MSERTLEFVDAFVEEFRLAPDAAVLAALAAMPELADASADVWQQDEYWEQVAARYLALAEVASVRRLREAIPLLLDRACFGDPGEIMRGLRHNLEAIVKPEWGILTDLCLKAARSPRPGTRLWAVDELAVLADPRSESVLLQAALSEVHDIRWRAEKGLRRLAERA